ncbi:DNA-binding transcriptional LysR family regulator [Silvimonas terrae]|uniref:DNA-binding transcriptional LysR family regulator n=1 Tax=Silvimonas terrae TaxID=300266 RepID=A0A840RIG9_9NEIS|nr:LysR family transcriptional regulator [Silvimonas terrae]MBB5192042.1 DNA-binding transcriptional LysR family regulator [Silvimonas terrae]
MNLRQIEFAVAVAEEQSFTRAAERCHTVQSALSHQIAKLEDELGAKLFERSSRNVKLTVAGQAFLPVARQMLGAESRIRDEVAAAAGTVRGTLTVGTISTFNHADLVDVLARFHERYPHVDIRFYQGMSENLLVDVRAERTDVALVGLWPGEPVEGVSKQTIADEELIAIVPQAHPLAQRDQISLLDLVGSRLVDFYANSGARRQTEQAFARAGIAHKVSFEVSHIDLLERIVRRGLAIGLVPRFEGYTCDRLKMVPVSDGPQRRVWAVWNLDPTPAAVAFLRMVHEALIENGHEVPEPRVLP